MSAGYELPEHLFIHGYLKLGGEKMSKTRGNVMDPFPLIEQYGADPFRFYCLREVNFGQDGVVGEESFKNRYNAELANELGNLLSRTASMIGKYRGGNVPAPPESAAHSPLVEEAAATVAAARDGLQDFNLSGGLEAIWGFVRGSTVTWRSVPRGSRPKPVKTRNSMPPCGTWPRGCVCSPCCCTPTCPPPVTILRRLGIEPSAEAVAWSRAEWGLLEPKVTVETGAPLFPRIEE